MAHTYTCLHYHCVFSTLGRRNLIHADLAPRLHAYIGGIVKNIKGLPVKIGGEAEHVHLLIGLPADLPIAAAMRAIKSNSSGWIHETFPLLSDFAWQEGYGAFTVSRSNLDAVARYIGSQRQHHRTMTFQEELVGLLRKHGIDYDERHIRD